MKLKISVEDMNEEAERTILEDIRVLVNNFSTDVGLRRFVKIEEVK